MNKFISIVIPSYFKLIQLPITSRNHGEREPHVFPHCGSFDHHALQSLKNYKFVFIDLQTDT